MRPIHPRSLPAPAAFLRRRLAVHRRADGRHPGGRAGHRRRVAGPGLLPASHPVGVPRAGPQRRPLLSGGRRPPHRPPPGPGAGAVLGPDRGVLPGPKRLPEAFFSATALRAGRALDAGVNEEWLWKRRRAYAYDGSSVTMPDTPANPAAYPQPVAQKPRPRVPPGPYRGRVLARLQGGRRAGHLSVCRPGAERPGAAPQAVGPVPRRGRHAGRPAHVRLDRDGHAEGSEQRHEARTRRPTTNSRHVVSVPFAW
jgi:hypothetical protein